MGSKKAGKVIRRKRAPASKPRSSATRVPLEEFVATADDWIRRVRETGERLVITRNGRAVAGLVPADEAEWLQSREDADDLEAAAEAAREVAALGTVPLEKFVSRPAQR